jgi:hypothetical protein
VRRLCFVVAVVAAVVVVVVDDGYVPAVSPGYVPADEPEPPPSHAYAAPAPESASIVAAATTVSGRLTLSINYLLGVGCGIRTTHRRAVRQRL